MTKLTYAIGDIHGDLTQLRAMHKRIDRDADGRDHTVVHVGDLVDRREDSRGVIDHLMEGQTDGKPWVVLKGNHDRMMTLFIRHGQSDPCLRSDYHWLFPQLGGIETLASYGIDVKGMSVGEARQAAVDAVPASHIDYLEALPVSFETESVFFCHAGILPGVPLDAQIEDDLTWIRRPFHDHPGPHPKLIVHGHTPVDRVTHYGHRINIDTGCAYGGPLSAIVFDAGTVYELTASGRAGLPVTPKA